jgi:hypothetical protein
MKAVRSIWRTVAPLAVVTVGAVAWLALAVSAGAQTAGPAKPAPAKAAKPAKKAEAPEVKMVLEPRAMDLLRAMSTKLAAAKSMSFTATASYEYPSKLGPPIVYTTRYDVTMQRPDKLRILMPGDGPASEFYYNGKAMIVYAPAEDLAAVADAPPTIDAALDAAYKNAAIFFPFEDLLAADPYNALTTGAILAFYIGPSSVIGDTKTEMVAWAGNEVFLQIWIGVDDKLPRRVRAIYRNDPLALRHQVDLSNWQLDPAVAPETFVSAKAQTAGRMAFAAPAPPPKGVKPLKAKPAAAAQPAAKSN